MKQEPCTQCLDILVDMISYSKQDLRCLPRHTKTLVKLLGNAISRYEEKGIAIPLKYYEKYHSLMDKYEPDWRDNGLLYLEGGK